MAHILTKHLMALVFLGLALCFILIRLGHPAELVFDETHYVPAARALLALSHNTNMEHPLFAKQMIALGINWFGDNPFGWRIFGGLISAFAIWACFHISFMLFRDLKVSFLTTSLILLNITFVVQSRLAMLDTYTYPLLIFSAGLLIYSAQRNRSKFIALAILMTAGVFLGLAAGSKWIAGIYAMLTLIGLSIARLVATLSAGRPFWQALTGADFKAWPSLNMLVAGLAFGLPAILVYFLTFWPILVWDQQPVALKDVLSFQLHMYELQTRPLAPVDYKSDWWAWPIMLEPIWYYFEPVKNGGHEAIFYLGNPVIYWGGLLALVFALIQSVRQQNTIILSLVFCFLASWLLYAVLPKQIGYLFYYHGSAILLCFVIGASFHLLPKGRVQNWASYGFLALAVIAFLFFFPVIYAVEMPRDQWLNYIWIRSWA